MRTMSGKIFFVVYVCFAVSVAPAQLILRPDVKIPELPGFRPLPKADPGFSQELAGLVKAARLDEHTPPEMNVDKEEEWSSICLVDISNTSSPRVASWEAENFIYPCSTYKMYVVGELIRELCAGQRTLDDVTTVSGHNVRVDSKLTTGQQVTLSEVMRLVCQDSDNGAANVAIDLADRQRASALLRAMGCTGSDITRKYLPRPREDEEYKKAPSTVSNALHFATFLWAIETGAIGGGRGRGLIKGYLSMIVTNSTRMRAGLPASATVYSKTGEWETFTDEAGIIEDGPVRYILVILTALPEKDGAPRIAQLTRLVHEMMWRKQQLK